MDTREQRGMELAATRTISKKAGVWIVPSQTGKGTYRVNIMPRIASCTCPDFETRGTNCKHIYAAKFVIRREQNADGSVTVTESLTMTAETQTTYPQAWAAYNQAQTNEKDKFQSLLANYAREFGSHKSARRAARVCRCRTRFSASRSRSTPRLAPAAL